MEEREEQSILYLPEERVKRRPVEPTPLIGDLASRPDNLVPDPKKKRPFLNRLKREWDFTPLPHKILTAVAIPAGIASLTALVIGVPLAAVLDSQELRNISGEIVVGGFVTAIVCEVIARHWPQSRSR